MVRRAHAPEAVETRAPKKVQEDRLGLIVRGVAGQHIARKDAVPRRSGPGLEVGPELYGDAPGLEGRTESRRRSRDHLGLGLGTRPQTVIDVDSCDSAAPLRREQEQRHRIRTT
jgi:hypothetical protein